MQLSNTPVQHDSIDALPISADMSASQEASPSFFEKIKKGLQVGVALVGISVIGCAEKNESITSMTAEAQGVTDVIKASGFKALPTYKTSMSTCTHWSISPIKEGEHYVSIGDLRKVPNGGYEFTDKTGTRTFAHLTDLNAHLATLKIEKADDTAEAHHVEAHH